MCNLRLAPNVRTRLQAMFRATLSQAWHLSERSGLFGRCSKLFFQIFKHEKWEKLSAWAGEFIVSENLVIKSDTTKTAA